MPPKLMLIRSIVKCFEETAQTTLHALNLVYDNNNLFLAWLQNSQAYHTQLSGL